MKNKFRYALSLQDYVNYYRLMFKRTNLIPFFVMACFFTAMSVYNAVITKDFIMPLCVIAAVVISGIYMIFHYNNGIKRTTEKQLGGTDSYFKPLEITIDSSTVEINNLPQDNEAGIVAVYPYSIMNAIYETNDYFVFIIGNEAKILPKNAIPQEMRESVFKEIKKSPKCFFMK